MRNVNLKRWRLPIIIAVFLLLGILAILLQDVIRRVIIVPVAYLLWVLKYYYSTIPQVFIWILLPIVIVQLLSSFISRGFIAGRKQFLLQTSNSGSVENMVEWLTKSRGGNFFKWRVANRLGKIARELVPANPGSGKSPSGNVKRYLEAGLNESFVDYPLRSWFKPGKKQNPFDSDLNEVILYLESLLEEKHEH